MLIICERHGSSDGILVSPDLLGTAQRGGALPAFSECLFVVDDEPFFKVALSHHCAKERGIEVPRVLHLADGFPDWSDGLVPLCHACWVESI